MDITASPLLPPNSVEYNREDPEGSSLEMKPSPNRKKLCVDFAVAPLNVRWYALAVVGKSDDRVPPPTYTFPAPSSAMDDGASSFEPPKSVLNTSAEPDEFNFATNTSPVRITLSGPPTKISGCPPKPFKEV